MRYEAWLVNSVSSLVLVGACSLRRGVPVALLLLMRPCQGLPGHVSLHFPAEPKSQTKALHCCLGQVGLCMALPAPPGKEASGPSTSKTCSTSGAGCEVSSGCLVRCPSWSEPFVLAAPCRRAALLPDVREGVREGGLAEKRKTAAGAACQQKMAAVWKSQNGLMWILREALPLGWFPTKSARR